MRTPPQTSPGALIYPGIDRAGPGTSLPACPACDADVAGGPPLEDAVDYAVTAIFVLIGLIAVGLVRHMRHETRFESRPSLAAARRAMSRSRLVASVASGECSCGGMLGPTGTVSARYGPLLGCTSCRRTWTDDGRRVIRRPARRGRSARRRRPV
jgi:hypothetical protein